MLTDIVITGAGIVSALGVGQQATLNALRERRTGIGPVRHLTTPLTAYPVGEADLTSAEMARRLGLTEGDGPLPARTILMGRLALIEAVSQAGLWTPGHGEALRDVPFISGTTVAGMERAEEALLATDPERMADQLVDTVSDCGHNSEAIASAVGRFAWVDSPSTACASAAAAIQLGAALIESGQCTRAVVGGTESLSRFHLAGFRSLMILDPEACRPFDAGRAGLNLGEGAAYLVIERADVARRRGAQPLGRLLGCACACDAYHQTASSPDGEGALRAMRQAIAHAGLTPADIDYVNAHGTGTPNNDASELAAMGRLFDAMPPYSSTKGFTGHTTSASGSIEAVICLLALREQFLPVNLGLRTPIEGAPSPVTAATSQPQRPLRHVLCNAFGFGGSDTSLVFGRIEPDEDWTSNGASAGASRASDDGIGRNEEEDDAAAAGCGLKADASRASDDVMGQEAEAPGIPVAGRTEVYVVAHRQLAPDDEVDYRRHLTPGEARRLTRLLRRALCLSLDVMAEGGIERPDAIVTGTWWGTAESTLAFLRDMQQNEGQMLKPTPFMQSTHNTIGALIAINTHNHGYNSTHAQGSASLAMALHDAWTQMQLGHIGTALVGVHDMLPQWRNEVLLLATPDALPAGHRPIARLTFTPGERPEPRLVPCP